MRLSRICLWGLAAGVVATIVAPLVGMLAFQIGRPERLFATGLIVVGFFAVALGQAAVIENGRARGLMWSGFGAGVLAAVLWITATWVTGVYSDFFTWQKAFTWPVAYACFVMITGVLLLVRADEQWHIRLRLGTITIVALLGVLIAGATSLHPGYDGTMSYANYEETAARIGAVLALLSAGGVAGTLLGAWLCRVIGEPPVLDYWIRCPRCGHEQSLQTGKSACESCGLAVKMEVA